MKLLAISIVLVTFCLLVYGSGSITPNFLTNISSVAKPEVYVTPSDIETNAPIETPPFEDQALRSSIPEHVLYESIFRMDLSFRRKALEQELSGQTVTSLKTYFKDEFGLNDEEDDLLRQTAIEYLEDIEPVNAQAIQLLAQLREQFQDGEIPDGQFVPAPPPALADLQSQRNSIALQSRDKLANRLGKKFEMFDGLVKTRFAANFQSLGPNRQQ